jgi:hypothetical protein
MHISGTQQQTDMVTYSLAGLNSGPLSYQTGAIPQIKPNGRGHSKAFTCSFMSLNLGPFVVPNHKGFPLSQHHRGFWIYIFELKRGRALQSMWTSLLSVCWKGIVSLWAFSFECELVHFWVLKSKQRHHWEKQCTRAPPCSYNLSLCLCLCLSVSLSLSLSSIWSSLSHLIERLCRD